MKYQLIVILCMFILTGCGGGGSGSNPPPAKVAQAPLVFSTNNVGIAIDETAPPNLLSGGSGTGAVSYNSNNSAVVSVNATTGALTIVSAGEAIITATKAADAQYNSITAHYKIIIHLKQQAPLVFSQSELSIYLNSTPPPNELSGGSGTGAITYSSNDTRVLSVNPSTGTLEAMSEGAVQVTAKKAADNMYAESSASYVITVKKVIKDLEIGIGVLDTEFKWQVQSDVVRILRSTDINCIYETIESCENNRDVSVAGSTSHTDSLINLQNPGFVVLESNGHRSRAFTVEPTVADISKRFGSAYFVFAGKIWAMAGAFYEHDPEATFYNAKYFNDLWSSTDGITWTREKENTGVATNYNFQVINFRGELYLLGGMIGEGSGGVSSLGIWKSKNALDWDLIQNSPPFGGVCGQFYTFKDKLWCYRNGNFNNDIWSSTDGVTWKEEADVTQFNRSNIAFYTINDKLFMAGGCESCWENHHELKNDIWSTTDGTTWIKELESAAFPPLERMKITELNGKWILTGGIVAADHHNKSLVSEDGIHWAPLGDKILNVMSWEHEIVNFKNQLYLYSDVSIYSASGSPNGTLQGYTWKSADGANWRIPLNTNLQWTAIK